MKKSERSFLNPDKKGSCGDLDQDPTNQSVETSRKLRENFEKIDSKSTTLCVDFSKLFEDMGELCMDFSGLRIGMSAIRKNLEIFVLSWRAKRCIPHYCKFQSCRAFTVKPFRRNSVGLKTEDSFVVKPGKGRGYRVEAGLGAAIRTVNIVNVFYQSQTFQPCQRSPEIPFESKE